MTDPVIIKHCDTCEAKTLHARDQKGKPDPARVVTERICSECGTTTTHTKHFQDE
jgi:hypothetical protein